MTTSSTKKLLSVLSESLLEVEVMLSGHNRFRVQINTNAVCTGSCKVNTRHTGCRVHLEVEVMNKHRRLRVLLKGLKRIEHSG